MLRIHKLKLYFQESLKNKGIKDVLDFIQSIIDADITKGKYARFLIEAFLNDKFLEEDLIGGVDSTVGQAIRLFHKHKSKLSENMRSVYALDKETGEALYQSPGDLWNSVKQFQGELSGKELKKEEQEKVYRETEFVYKDEETGFQIISPLTKESAQWWGKGTRWCTSADNDNMFWDYAKDAPLFILLMPNGGKLQLWKYEHDIQFMDEADNIVSLEYIKQNWKLLEPICLWLNDLLYIPEKYIKKELCELAVKQNGEALYYVLEKYITPELCKLAVKQNGNVLHCVPERLKTKEICELAIEQDGKAIADVPKKYLTKELYELAVKINGEALKFIPEHLKTKELYEMAVKQNGNALDCIPEQYKTKEMCELAIKQYGGSLYFVPEELRTPELCKLAVKNNGEALEFIPESLITKELYEIAVQQNGMALRHVPIKLRTEELCELAVKQDGYALVYILENLRTKELYNLAIQQNKNVLQIIPRELQNNFKQYIKDEAFELPLDKYQETFQKIKTFFLIKDVS